MNNRLVRFLRKNLVYVILSLCILAIGLSVTLVMINDKKPSSNQQAEVPVVKPDKPDDNKTPEENKPSDSNKPDDSNQPSDSTQPSQPSQPTVTEITFIMPVDGVTDIKHFAEVPVFNSTLGIYTGHRAVDFFAPEGTNVLAVYGGTIEKVENSLLQGITITIDHGNGLKTVYNSLADADTVFQGQTVKQGDVIGTVSTTNKQEYKDGAHLHFQVIEDGEIIDPSTYLTFIEK